MADTGSALLPLHCLGQYLVSSLSLLHQQLLASGPGWVSLPELKNELTLNLLLVINVSLRLQQFWNSCGLEEKQAVLAFC